jgi:broad specificity phosphatase PhoE
MNSRLDAPALLSEPSLSLGLPDARRERLVTRVLLIRHAHVDTGPAPGRLCGALDLPISGRGWAQVAAMRERAARCDAPAAIYTSTLKRARAVAVALASVWAIQVHPRESLREISCGAVEGLPLGEVQRRFPEVWARHEAQLDDTFAWPGGESCRAFRARVLAGLGEITAAHPGQRIAVITHAGVVTQVLGAIRGRSPAVWAADRPEPLSATEVTWANGSPRTILSFNQSHWH